MNEQKEKKKAPQYLCKQDHGSKQTSSNIAAGMWIALQKLKITCVTFSRAFCWIADYTDCEPQLSNSQYWLKQVMNWDRE